MTEEPPSTEVRQAGAIAVRIAERNPEVLVVQARKDPRHWIFPKGHIERDETPEAAATRELLEETGVEGRVLGYAGTLRFDSGGEDVRVDYYLVRALREGPSGEGRRLRWCTRDEARDLLTFQDARRLLENAWPMVERELGE